MHDRLLQSLIYKDPDMFGFVRRRLHKAFDGIWTDVEEEVKTAVKTTVLKKQEWAQPGDPPHCGCFPFCGQKSLCGPGARIRAWVLDHDLPFDHTAFGEARDPANPLS